MKSKIYTFIIVLLVSVSALAAAFFYSQWRGMMQENAELRASLDSLRGKAGELRKEWEFKNEYYNRLVSDDEFAERVIREKLGYAYPGDIVFRFKDSEPADIDDNAESLDFPKAPAEKQKGFFSRVWAFFGFEDSPDGAGEKSSVPSKYRRPAVPEYRIDMKNASVAAVENRRAAESANGDSNSANANADPAPASSPVPAANGNDAPNPRGVLVAVSMKPVKVKLGGTNASVKQAPARAPKPVRFLVRNF